MPDRANYLIQRSDENYVAAFRTLAVANGLPNPDLGGIVCAPTGMPEATLNIAFVTRPLANPEGAIRETAAFFERIGLPFVLRIREGVDPAAEGAAESLGLPYTDTVPGLAMDSIPQMPPPPPPGLEIRAVNDVDQLHQFHHVVADGFGIPVEAAQLLMRESILQQPAVVAFIGISEGVPVAASTLVRSPKCAGVYNVATLPEYRGRGFGEAMTWQVVAAGAAAGCDVAILQPSEMGRPIYERMGFRLVASYRTFRAQEGGAQAD